jgi:hypothetical protein
MDEKQTPRRTTRKMGKINFHNEKNTNTKTMNRREQVVISRLRTGYTRATHASVINKDLTKYPVCAVKRTIDHILCEHSYKRTTLKRSGKAAKK